MSYVTVRLTHILNHTSYQVPKLKYRTVTFCVVVNEEKIQSPILTLTLIWTMPNVELARLPKPKNNKSQER